MKVYISIDMEGVAGIATMDQAYRGGSGYPAAQHLMTAEANAAVAGAFDAGADEVVINDSHGTMDNLILDDVDERATLILGRPKAQCMIQGLTAEYDIALFLGYHAAAGEPGVLSHTLSDCFAQFLVNGEVASETRIGALQAAAQGVPVGLVTGDDVICSASEREIPGVTTVAVKRAVGHLATHSWHPHRARQEIRAAAARAVAGADRLRPVPLPERLVVRVQLRYPDHAELGALIPGVRQIDPVTLEVEVLSPDELVAMATLWWECTPSRPW